MRHDLQYKNAQGWRLLILFAWLAIWFQPVIAQQKPFKFTHLTNLDGLSQSNVQAIVKDRLGFMWFGTQDGLNRYDGYTFKVYRHKWGDSPSLRRSHVVCLYEDRQGTLWVGTNNGALSKYDRDRDAFVNFPEMINDRPGLSQRTVTSMFEDRQGNFWVGTYWKLNLLDRVTGKVTHFGHSSSDPGSISDDGINCIFEDSRNNLWIGTKNGLNLLDRKTMKFKRYLHNPADPKSLSHNSVQAIREDRNGRLWIGTDDGLNLFDRRSGEFFHFKKDPQNPSSIGDNGIRKMEVSEDGRLWLGTASSLEIFDPNTFSALHLVSDANDPTSLNRNGNVSSLFQDNEGILWVGTNQGGINKYDKHLTLYNTLRNDPHDWQSLSFNVITAFAEAKNGNVWIATGGGALNLWDRRSNHFVRFNPDPTTNSLSTWGLLSLHQSRKTGLLWIGSYEKGLDCYNPETNRFKNYSAGDAPDKLNNNAVYAILEDRRGMIWIGTNGGGINLLDPATGQITKHKFHPDDPASVAGDFVRCLFEDRKGRIWIGTTAGLSVFDYSTGKFSRYDLGNNTLESEIIHCLLEDARGHIWIGTLGGGLYMTDGNRRIVKKLTTDEGLPDNTINSVIEDRRGFLWISTNNGISRFDPATGSFKNSTEINGIQSFEFSPGAGILLSSGEILFGGVNGFNSFDPGSISINDHQPPVVITGLKLFNKTVTIHDQHSPLVKDITVTSEIRLRYDQSIITFEFSGLGYTAPEKNQYAYKMEGFDNHWNYVGTQRSATYTNLDPGTYIFKVKAANNDGVWSTTETKIRIRILPPFWLTWWFRAAVVLAIAGLVVYSYRARVSRVKKQRELLEKKVNEQTEQLRILHSEERTARLDADYAYEQLEKKNKEMEQFVYIASHDLREPLRTISGFAELFQKQYRGKVDEKADKFLNYISQASERMKRLIDDLLDYSRIAREKQMENVDCAAVLGDVLSDLGNRISESEAQVRCDSMPVIWALPVGIKQVFQNIVANAVKFRKKDVAPIIHIRADDKGSEWQFSIQDNGIGIDPKFSERIFAIFQRLHTREEYEGSGIGLAHCKKIIELHKGKIWLESEPGIGTTFYFTIPKINTQ